MKLCYPFYWRLTEGSKKSPNGRYAIQSPFSCKDFTMCMNEKWCGNPKGGLIVGATYSNTVLYSEYSLKIIDQMKQSR